MTPQQWERLKTLFHGALEQPANVRDEWLHRIAGDDADVIREARALLHAHDTAADFLETPPAIDPSDLIGPEAGPYASFEAGTRLGAYVIQQEIGRGGMGVVYLAEDERLRRRVAVKVLAPLVASDETSRERLRREARAAATISHPSVAVVYALEEIDAHLLLVTEYVPGQTLRARIEQGALPALEAAAIAGDIARALAAAHEAGVIHRDLKPDNVIITASGAVKVVDFGIAYMERPDAAQLTAAGATPGTPAYMAPEQLVGAKVDARADIYSAGVTMFEMLTGRHPLQPGATSDRTPGPLADIAARCLQQDPALRYQSARELVTAIERAAIARPADRRTASRWWWEFHQGAAALAYWLMVIPAWNARALIDGMRGRLFFILVLTAVIVAASLRLHLWFTSRFYPAELRWLRARVARWIAAADWLFSLALVAGGLLVGDDRSPLAAVLLSVGMGAGVVFLVIEPATTRAAFRKPQASSTSSRSPLR